MYIFYLADTENKKLSITGNNRIVLKSKRALSYSFIECDTRFTKKFLTRDIFNMGTFLYGKTFGRNIYPYDCSIFLDNLKFSEKTRVEQEAEQEKRDLARAIIAKKYGAANADAYVKWLNRCDYMNLHRSLNIGGSYYVNTIPFMEGDMVLMKENLLSIENMNYMGNGYLYLVTASKNAVSKCCMIISRRQLSYVNYSYSAIITEPLLLKFEGRDQYQKGYQLQTCDVFSVIERGSKEYNDYIAKFNDYTSKVNDIAEIEKNPYAYKYILDE